MIGFFKFKQVLVQELPSSDAQIQSSSPQTKSTRKKNPNFMLILNLVKNIANLKQANQFFWTKTAKFSSHLG
jgi:hypothetical protein